MQKNLKATLLFADFSKTFDFRNRGKMEQILAYSLPKKTVTAITMFYKNTKAMVCTPKGDTDVFDIVAGIFQEDTLTPYLFIICLDYVLQMSIDLMKQARSR